MSSPSIEALTRGKRCSALAAALTKKLMKPSLMPWAFWNSSCSSLRAAETLLRLTSLKVVSIAVEFFDSIRRLAMVLRTRVIGTRSSGRAPAALPTPPDRAKLTMSSLVTAPRRPVPSTWAGSTPSVSAENRAPGGSEAVSPAALGASALAAFGASAALGASFFSSLAAGLASSAAGLAGAASAAAPSSITARTCEEVTVSPSWNLISLSTPSTGEGTSRTTLSVSRSTRFSSRLTASPAFLCQLAMVASETDSGSAGTLTSVAMRGAS